MREIQADTETILNERNELLDDIRATANGLIDIVDSANARLPGREAVEPLEETEVLAAGTPEMGQTGRSDPS
jgi:hypothetical protein